jgi:hypothetical protein
LAADSAVTLTVRGEEKVYNSADKLFELSNRDPIGIMIYNNLEFMGLNFEVAVKHFRDHVATQSFLTVFDAADAFFTYLSGDLLGDVILQKQHARAMLLVEVRRLRDEWNRAVSEEYSKRRNRTDFAGILSRTIESRHNHLASLETAECFSNTLEGEIDGFYSDVLEEVREAWFSELPLTDEHKKAIRDICVLTLMKDEYSEAQTGMVFAGFGEHEKFPSLVAYQVEGIIANRLKKRETDRVVTDRENITGEILPFAQREMVDRFLYGVDPDFEIGIEGFIETTITATCKQIVERLPRTSRATKKA